MSWSKNQRRAWGKDSGAGWAPWRRMMTGGRAGLANARLIRPSSCLRSCALNLSAIAGLPGWPGRRPAVGPFCPTELRNEDLLDRTGQVGDDRVAEHLGDRQVNVQPGVQRGNQARGEQGMTAEREEIIERAHLAYPQHLTKGLSDNPLERGLWRGELAGLGSWCGVGVLGQG